ncbi:hypothetical protein [Actinoplanes sp. L3-i22]|uniref:hypothetical protein n=1 Tax=Actinoplanes sp. L3-i22 TaxID=2836373 RepID=UPI001C74010E|nr:hypothetical protein [Actinoplanes sp. L3-i22]BCY06574.1 hypothetical protein L3i22_016620 [Actinoplanes sp. L3-i22]
MTPDDVAAFRCARLLVLLHLLEPLDPEGTDAERIGLYDFFAAHPLLLFRAGDPERLNLRLSGFDDRALAYASPAQRFVTAQQRLPGDLLLLVRSGLAEQRADGRIRFRLTGAGRAARRQVNAAYAVSYRTAARAVVRRLRPLSGRRLRWVARLCLVEATR